MIDELLDGSIKKLIFVSVWFSFAFALFLLNRQHKRRTFDAIQSFGSWRVSENNFSFITFPLTLLMTVIRRQSTV